MEARINFPAGNDTIWNKINEELEIIIPQVFNQQIINKLSPSELSQKFDSWLHTFFLEKFGKHFKKRKPMASLIRGAPTKL